MNRPLHTLFWLLALPATAMADDDEFLDEGDEDGDFEEVPDEDDDDEFLKDEVDDEAPPDESDGVEAARRRRDAPPEPTPEPKKLAPARLRTVVGSRAGLGLARQSLGGGGDVHLLGGVALPQLDQRVRPYVSVGFERTTDQRSGTDAATELTWTADVSVVQVPVMAGVSLRAMGRAARVSPELDLAGGLALQSTRVDTQVGDASGAARTRAPSRAAIGRVGLGASTTLGPGQLVPQVGWAASQVSSDLAGTASLSRLDLSLLYRLEL